MEQILIKPGAIQHISDHVPRAHSYAVIADSNVSKVLGSQVANVLPNAHLLEFPAGEPNKTRETWATITDAMLDRNLGRDTCVIAVGGGVTCDVAGFVAATYLRGVPVVQVPTSLLAMIDAAIGGKTGVDVAAGKNLVGAFHQPYAVVIDPLVLQTLPDAELSNGLAEAIKHGAIADAAYLQWIVESAASIFERRTDSLKKLISRSVEIKNSFVQDDRKEAGKRAALNFGHTIGHALEQVSGYAIAHGHAVGLGMLIEAEIGSALEITRADAVKQIYEALKAVRLPHTMVVDESGPLLEATRTDKKVREGKARYVLLEQVGAVATKAGEWTWEVPDDVVREALKQFSV
jgi:3-dehydroquinate synthase